MSKDVFEYVDTTKIVIFACKIGEPNIFDEKYRLWKNTDP